MPVRPGPTIDGVGLMTRWWDRWLKGERNGVDEGPALTVFAVEPEGAQPFPDGRCAGRRPGPLVGDRPLAVRPPDRASAAAPPGRRRIRGPRNAGRAPAVGRRREPTPGPAGRPWRSTAPFTCTGSEPQGGPLDQRPDDAGSLVYTGEPLAEPVLVVGIPVVDLWVAADRPVAQVAVRLEAVAPDGASALLARGLLNLTRRHSFADPEPIVPGEIMAVSVPLTATGARVPAGQRLRIAIAGAAFPIAWPPPVPVALTLFHDAQRPSRLRLPTPAGWSPATEELGTGVSDPGLAEHLPGIADTWRVERDDLAATTTLVSEFGGGHRFPERDGLVFAADERFRIIAHDDWAHAAAHGSALYRVAWPGGPDRDGRRPPGRSSRTPRPSP